MVRSSSTELTPGADHAARSASLRSAQERTLPRRITVSFTTVTLIWFMSSSAARRNAFSIAVFTSEGRIDGS
jgi:hypothetical protein